MAELTISWTFNQSKSVAWSNMRLLNMYAEKAQESTSKSPIILFSRPALKLFASLPVTGMVRGIHTMRGVPFIVCGSNVYTLSSNGTATDLGAIGGTDIVDMADNGTQVCIVSENKGFIATSATVTKITNPSFRTPSSVTFQDTYFIFSETNTNNIFRSDSLDGFSYNSLNVSAADYNSDILVKVFSDRDELWAFGEDNIQFYYNDQTTALSFTPAQGKVAEIGCLSRNTIKKVAQSVIWLGSDARGGRVIWRAVNSSPSRISTHAIETVLDGVVNPSDAYALAFRIEGHDFYILTITDLITFVYDATSGIWTEWGTFNKNSWHVLGFSNAFNKRLVGGSSDNNIYELDNDEYTDNGLTIEREGITQPFYTANQSLGKHSSFILDIQAGVGLPNGYGSDPKITLSWAKDNVSFNNPKPRSMGKIGERSVRLKWNRLGISRYRSYKWRCTDPVECTILGGFLDLQQGTNM